MGRVGQSSKFSEGGVTVKEVFFVLFVDSVWNMGGFGHLCIGKEGHRHEAAIRRLNYRTSWATLVSYIAA